ncbi:MAG TPA: hypothetical protein VFG81_13465 [Anaerolineales bacterium]|jgi:hypothetical protein|nr:hypothetical protein [Anaerolineales bacterium]
MNSQGIPIAWPLRLWLAVEVLFGIGAVLAIGRDPANSATNFAWPIQPVVMAATLGAFYITSAPLFLLPLFAKRWENIRAMILPTALFSTVQLAATFLHWDKFSIGTTPFYVWFASYLLPPPIFVAAYLWHQRKAGSPTVSSNDPIPSWLHRLLILCGSLLTLIAVLTFFFPGFLIPVFPWQLTPLTARSLSGWLIAVGTIMLWMARENDRTRARLATPMLILILPALLLQIGRFAKQVNWSSPVLWIGFLLFAVVGFCGVYLANGSWREALR